MSPFPQLTPGTVFSGQFKLIGLAGKGGFGEVWKAWDIAGNRNVALKFIGSDIRDNTFAFIEEGVNVFKNFQDTQSLNHQHICPIYGFRTTDIGPCLIMKWLEGESLSNRHLRYLRQGKLIPQHQVNEILLEVASALDYAHSRGIVHCDVKPANIHIEKDTEDAILLDFGIADVIHETQIAISRTMTSATSEISDRFIGTPEYMSPEQWKGKNRYYNGRTDQYSLAVIAYELLSGDRPFNLPAFLSRNKDNLINYLGKDVLTQTPDEIEGLSSVTNAALQKALSKRKEDRFFNCWEFVRSLELERSTGIEIGHNTELDTGIGKHYPEHNTKQEIGQNKPELEYNANRYITTDWISKRKALKIPEGIVCIRDRFCYDDSGVKKIWIPNGIPEVVIPKTVTEIGSCAFSHCTSIILICIPKSVLKIERLAFTDCSSLTRIDIPKSVKHVGEDAFINCSSLETISVPKYLDLSKASVPKSAKIIRY